jgi:hypothetical protein
VFESVTVDKDLAQTVLLKTQKVTVECLTTCDI